MMGRQLTFIDFFAGVGGFRLGLERVGMRCVGFCENDKFAVRSYRAMYETEGEWYGADITKLTADAIPKADIWCAGSPCQNVSLAGGRAGIHGERSGLFFNFIDLIKGQKEEDKPEWVLLENVKGLLSSHAGWDFLDYLGELAEAGYDVEWDIFNSRDFGVPQSRERVYTIGHLRVRGRRKILLVSPTSHGHLKQVVNLRRQGYRVYEMNGVSSAICGEGGGVGAKTGLYLIDQSLVNPKITDTARCLVSHYTAGIVNRRASNSGVLEVQHPRAVIDPSHVSKNQNGRRVKDVDEPMFTLTAQDRHGVVLEEPNLIKVRSAVNKGYEEAAPGDSIDLAYPKSETRRARVGQGVAHNLTCSGSMGVVTWNGKQVRIRRLTPRECFRLQGFPDELFDRARAVNSDAQLYKQAGNGVTVPVVSAIGQAILDSYANCV